MKKLFALVVALALLLSLCTLFGCSREEALPESGQQQAQPTDIQRPQTETESPDGTENPTLPGETESPDTVPEEDPGAASLAAFQAKVDGGEKFLVGIIPPSLTAQRLANICQYISDYFTDLGSEAQIVDAQRNEVNFITNIENFVTMGADIIFVVPMQPDAIMDVCVKAMEQGTNIVMLGVTPAYEVSGLLRTDFYATGKAAANMLLTWAHAQWPMAAEDSIPVAVGGQTVSDDGVQRTNGFLETIEADPYTYVAFHSDFKDANSADETIAFTQDALTYNPEIRCFLFYEIAGAIASTQYIVGRSDLDYSEFGVFCVGQSDAGLQLVDQSVTNDNSCLRGCISYGGEQPGVQLTEIGSRLLGGESGPIVYFDEIYTYNHIGYEVDV